MFGSKFGSYAIFRQRRDLSDPSICLVSQLLLLNSDADSAIYVSIRRLLYQNGDKPTNLVLAMNPLLLPLRVFYETKGSSIQTDLVFGLYLLVESYRSFTLPKRAVSMPNSRIQMLRFVQMLRTVSVVPVYYGPCWPMEHVIAATAERMRFR